MRDPPRAGAGHGIILPCPQLLVITAVRRTEFLPQGRLRPSVEWTWSSITCPAGFHPELLLGLQGVVLKAPRSLDAQPGSPRQHLQQVLGRTRLPVGATTADKLASIRHGPMHVCEQTWMCKQPQCGEGTHTLRCRGWRRESLLSGDTTASLLLGT